MTDPAAFSDLPVGYFGKLTGGDRGLGMRSLGPVLGALQLVLVVQANDLADASSKDGRNKPKKRLVPRQGRKNFNRIRAQRAAQRKWLRVLGLKATRVELKEAA
jgi:hypothetical protein